LSWAPVRESATTLWLLLAAVLVAVAGVVALVTGVRRRVRRPAALGLIGIAASTIAGAGLLTVPAYPTTYAASPVRYTTVAIADGARLFAAHCAACHGGDGAGVTVASAAAAPDLNRHAAHRRPGGLYWWIAHGRAGTAMPAFSPPLTSEEVWSIVQFLHARSDAADFAGDHPGTLATSPVAAPDFSFELRQRGQETLVRPDAAEDTLLVLYSLPDSLARLHSLASHRHAFDDRRIRVLALAESVTDAQIAAGQIPGGDAIVAIVAPDVAVVYAMFAARNRATARHAEFLIDRRGRLRARWLGVPAPGDNRDRALFAAAHELGGGGLLPPPSEHAH
jgi:mono/diheme cytochrome c family protein